MSLTVRSILHSKNTFKTTTRFAFFTTRNISTSMPVKGNKLHGKVAIVTASTAGIGYEIAKGLAESGAQVVISSRKENHVEDAINKLRAEYLEVKGVVCHVGKESDRKNLMKKTIDTYGKLDILVSNAGMSPYMGPLIDTPESAWDKIFDINLKSGFLLAQEAMPLLKETKGSILYVSSIGAYTPFTQIGAYSISKTAMLGLVKCLAIECAPFGVRVNGLAPGVIKTDFSSALHEGPVAKPFLRSIPIGRFGEAAECAGPAVFLSSDDASYITGETLPIAGGMPSKL